MQGGGRGKKKQSYLGDVHYLRTGKKPLRAYWVPERSLAVGEQKRNKPRKIKSLEKKEKAD